MTTQRDLDEQLRAYLRDGPDELPYESFDAVRGRTEQTRQRVVIGPWRTPDMSKIIGFGLAAAAVIVAAVIGTQVLGTSPNAGGPGPDASPSAEEPSPTVQPTPTPTPRGQLPEGPFAYSWPGMADDAPRITLTIPAPGWSSLDAGVLVKGEEVNNLPEAAIISWSESPGTEFYVYGDPCAWETTRPAEPATTVDEFVAALSAQATRDASEPIDVTVGGHPGKRITVHVPDDANPAECEGLQWTMFGTQAEDFARYNQGPGQIDELWIIDVEGSMVIFDTMYRPDTPDELVEELRSIAGSATFEVP